MEHLSKRRRIERNLGGQVDRLNLNNGRERSASLSGSSKDEKPITPKLVLPPHGAPGHPMHGDQAIDSLGSNVDRPHYPLEPADTKPTRVHARQIVQNSATDAAVLASGGIGSSSESTESVVPKTSDVIFHPNATPTSKADDNSYPGQVVPPAAVAAADARNQALESQQAQAQAVAVKQLDAMPQVPAPPPATHAAASASPNPMNVPNSSSQQIVKAPSTPPPSNPSPSPSPESSTSYFSASPASSPSPSPHHISSPSAASPTAPSPTAPSSTAPSSTAPSSTAPSSTAPSPTFTSTRHEIASSHNSTTSGKKLSIQSVFLCTDPFSSLYYNILKPE